MTDQAVLSTDDGRAKRNVALLSAGQALYGSHTAILVTLSGLAGAYLAPNPLWATFPWSALVIGTAVSTVPASMFMKRTSRRRGFMLGTALGIFGAALSMMALFGHSFVIFCLGMFICGAYQAFAGYYRFAAADTASEAFKPKAISWVLAGGVVAAFAGAQLVIATREFLGPVPFVGGFAACVALSLVAFFVMSFVNIPPLDEAEQAETGRPLPEIMKQKLFIVAAACGITGYGLMTLVMTATPLAMIACGFDVDDAATVIQWHILAMFVPSFFTGNLIARFGVYKVIGAGLICLTVCGFVALSGIELEQFLVALIFLGLGWNFTFLGATTLLTECYTPSERNKVQAANDLLVFGFVALASFASGGLLNGFGWDAVNYALFPFVLVAGVLAFIVSRQAKQAA